LPQFIARAIYDGAVTYRYITDAEVTNVKYIICFILISQVNLKERKKSFSKS